MSSPHPPYSHPGPSSYYSSPPPPSQFQYGPGPGPAPYYQYQVPPMNGHAVPIHQPTSPTRINGAGRGRFQTHRGGPPNYQHMPPIPHHHTLHPPAPMHSPPISPVSPYTHAQKYPQHAHHVPYSPPYAPQQNGPFVPAWPGQSLSPLPKQLSMLPPVLPPQSAHSQPEEPSRPPLSTDPPNGSQFAFSPTSQPSPQLSTPALEESSPSPSTHSELSAPPRTGSTRSSYVIWSRRPGDPSRAPGLIISSRAYPPEDIVQKAQELQSPPASPKVLRTIRLPQQTVSVVDDAIVMPYSVEESSQHSGVPSSSATETTPAGSIAADTPVPGSPLSSTTSVSISGMSPVDESVKNSLATEAVGDTKAPVELPPAESPAPSPVKPSVTLPSSEATPAAVPASPVAAHSPAAAPSPATAPSSPVPPPAQSAPAPAPVKKSWASLLQSSDGAASSSKSRLPVSAVVGFSIPADSAAGAQASAASPHRQELSGLLNSTPAAAAVPQRLRPRGLVNTGNMCFANAVLQILVYCPPFHKLFSELRKYLSSPAGAQRVGAQATPLVDATMQFLKEFLPEPAEGSDSRGKGKEREEDFDELDSFIPTYVYDAMKEKKRFANMIGGHQEDAEEFLGFFLDTLEEELLSLANSLSSRAPTAPEREEPQKDEGWHEVGKKNKAVLTRMIKTTESPITRIFGGKFRSTLRAPRQRDSVIVEDWRSLRLDIQRDQVNSIHDALKHISDPQPVQITSPTQPGAVIEASQQALIEALPPVLVLHLKRFLYDTTIGDVVKVGKQVTFTPELDIAPDLLAPTRRTAHPVKYQLFAVLNHHGLSASGGHYTLDVLHPNRGLSERPRPGWIRIDDELVSDIRNEDVFGGSETSDRCAYLLFYRRVGGWGPR
ncbi:cysteine proteinase [Obba rivulosa]|uniref:Ubiquitin carboxyl-terminal hydrolase n=1 Tax=Obba rivulosa TaxID=1052685 RepID=A0A8E2DQH5_9APHY|nr:cysteine proteinase [Obba rivulosa]